MFAAAWDAKGNLIADPVTGKSYGYSSENLLTSASGGGGASVSLSYDPLMRLVRTAGADPLGYQHDGADLVGEWYNDPQWGSSLLFRFVPGASIDEPVAEYYITLAVTQGNTVFVKHGSFKAFTTPGNEGRYEEIFHTRQFSVLGSESFYDLYVLGALGSAITNPTAPFGHKAYEKIPLERSAKQAAKAFNNMYAKERPCG